MSCSQVLGAAPIARVQEIVDLGALVSISRSRDGGAVSVTVTWDGVWERQWFRNEADAILQLDEWAGIIADEGPSQSPPADAQRRSRGRQNGRPGPGSAGGG